MIPILEKLKSFNLPSNQFAIFGSGPMFAHGIRDWSDFTDLDLIGYGEAWEIAKSKAIKLVYDEDWQCEIATLDDNIDIRNGWWPGDYNIKELIQTSDLINGFRWVDLNEVIIWKALMGRKKDLEHIRLIKEFLLHQPK
jgi:hypothetical protein